MLSRVYKEVKLPLPDDFFPAMTISAQRVNEYHNNAKQLLHETLHTSVPVSRLDPSQQPNQWKVIGNRNGLQLYRERGFHKGEAVKVHVMGQMSGTLDDVLLGLYATTNGALKTQRAILHPNYLDSAVLQVLTKDHFSEDDSNFSYQFSGLKWLACASSGKLVRKRDLCWYEELGYTQDGNGNKIGYLIMQSVQLNECPPLEFQGLTRSNAAVCYIFRPHSDRRVAVYMKGIHAVSGNSRSWSADVIMSELWLGVANVMECTKAKHLSTLVHRTEVFQPSFPRKTCAICDTKLTMLKRKQMCQLCRQNVCEQCCLTKFIYPLHASSNILSSHVFCKPCLSTTKEKLYARRLYDTMSVQLELDSSPESSPTTRIPLIERPEIPIMSLSADFTFSRQRIRLQEPRKRPNYPSTTTSTTVSLDLSTTDSKFRFNSSNDTKTRISSSPVSKSRSVQTSRVQRTSSNLYRRKFALRGYRNYQFPSSDTLIQFTNQSIDSTHDIQEIESYDYMSDESEVSEEFTIEDASLDFRTHEPIHLYDEREVLEIESDIS
ncbi:putative Zinc finger, FYVE/PHD-type, Zinc finger, RING/FYVE/PHD-type [Plasmopara halstedii]